MGPGIFPESMGPDLPGFRPSTSVNDVDSVPRVRITWSTEPPTSLSTRTTLCEVSSGPKSVRGSTSYTSTESTFGGPSGPPPWQG